MESISDTSKRLELRSKAEEFARKLVREYKERFRIDSISSKCIEFDGADSVRSEVEINNLESMVSYSDGGSNENRIGGKKRPFELFRSADSVAQETATLDEVLKYNLLRLDDLQEIRSHLLGDNFTIMEFWYNRKAQFPNLYAIATRIYATPVSSAASDRVFSALKLLFDDKRSRLGTSLVDDMIVVRSSHK